MHWICVNFLTCLFLCILILIVSWHCSSGDVPRVNGQLAVSRAFGDKSLKSHLRSDPDIRHADIDRNTDLLILASDGLWKVRHLIPTLFFPSFCFTMTRNIDEFPYIGNE